MSRTQAKKIVEAVLNNLSRRKGLDHELDAIDPEIYKEMKESLIDDVIKVERRGRG